MNYANLESLCIAQGMTLKSLLFKLRINHRNIRHWQSGKSPSRKTIKMLAAELRQAEEYILDIFEVKYKDLI